MLPDNFSISALIELPFGLPGRIFRSPMPFGAYDPYGGLMEAYQDAEIQVILMLVSDGESFERTGFDLRHHYLDREYEVLQMPVLDFGLPTREALQETIPLVLAQLQEGKNLVVHCFAGLGRTGLFMACLAKQVLEMEGAQAIHWVRQYLPTAVETSDQVQFVKDY